MERIYHCYSLWEDYKLGMYNNCPLNTKQYKIEKVIEMFNSEELTEKYMNKVIDEWFFSCEHNLTNESMNKIAYIGQAACCLYANVPCDVTMRAWKHLELKVKIRSDKIAKKTIDKWMLRQKSNNMLINGKKEDMKKVYQMKLLLF